MAWYVYGILRGEDAPPPAVAGLDGQAVELIREGAMAAAVSTATDVVRGLETAEPETVLAAVRAHDDALAVLAADRAVLPVRFGTVLPDDDAVRELLRDDGWGPRLDHVAAADEWVLTVTAPDQVEVDDGVEEGLSPGHAFFARRRSAATARQEARRRAVEVAESVHHELAAIARDWRVLDLRDPDVVARGAYLVPRDAAADVRDATDGHTGAIVSVQGPLPPYRFADR